ncbi:hypothetical protein BC332_19660 [Capsicum chinense]|nr:hypothetical protein BC332_19660 [Capsicum chinense]
MSSTIWSKDGGCPSGTVPNKRITKDDLLRQRHLPPPENVTFDFVAIARTPTNPNNKFAGAGMETNFYNPHVEEVGFWPQRIFTGLQSFVTNVEWEGVVYSPPGVREPPIGSSFFPTRNNLNDAYCKSITILNKEGQAKEVDRVPIYVDNPNLYKVLYERLSGDKESYLFVLYGGPGESAQA